ncbi:MAG: amino acid ABC transporter ATP-binding protein [Gemmataceae bacterium]
MDDYPIIVTNLTKRYGDRLVLDQVGFRVEPAETVALIGPSGGGKSTLLRCLNGLTDFNEGEVSVGPYHIRAQDPRNKRQEAIQQIRRRFGMIFQDFQLFPHLTAIQNVTEAPTRVLNLPHVKARQQATELLQRVGLGGHLDAWPQSLSGGQKQRVAIARALAMNPRGLLCDEITSALDPELKIGVLAILDALRAEGLTLIVVTHEIGFARQVADRVLVLADGKIIEEGPPSEVIDNPKVQRTKTFLHCVLEGILSKDNPNEVQASGEL